MDYQELTNRLNILEAHAFELYELIMVLDGHPVMRGHIIENLLSCHDKITRLKKQLQK
jgi:hypothetical protein